MDDTRAAETRLLVVEDDPSIVQILRLGFSYEGMQVDVALDGETALQRIRDDPPDLVLLDVMLPGIDGFAVLRRITAAYDLPVILLTARDELDDRVHGLRSGADDYVVKPFEFPELVARVHAVLRRRRGGVAGPDLIEVADLAIDRAQRTVTRGDDPIELTARQFDLLVLLAGNARRVLSKEQIYEAVWGWGYLANPNVVEQLVSTLRERVDRGRDPRLIRTVRGVGYTLRPDGPP